MMLQYYKRIQKNGEAATLSVSIMRSFQHRHFPDIFPAAAESP